MRRMAQNSWTKAGLYLGRRPRPRLALGWGSGTFSNGKRSAVEKGGVGQAWLAWRRDQSRDVADQGWLARGCRARRCRPISGALRLAMRCWGQAGRVRDGPAAGRVGRGRSVGSDVGWTMT